MLATPLEAAEGHLAPQGSPGPQGQREKQVSMVNLVPQDSKETRGSLEQLEDRAQLAPRALKENPGKARWWITMETSTMLSRRSELWP